MTPFLATSIAEGFCGGEDASEDEKHDAWQYLVDSGQCWHLQGWFGRVAMDLIERGVIKPAKKDRVNYYGNIVPGTDNK